MGSFVREGGYKRSPAWSERKLLKEKRRQSFHVTAEKEQRQDDMGEVKKRGTTHLSGD